MRENQVRSLGWEDPLEEEMAIHSRTIAWKSHGQRSLVGYIPWGLKESDKTEQLHFHFNHKKKIEMQYTHKQFTVFLLCYKTFFTWIDFRVEMGPNMYETDIKSS